MALMGWRFRGVDCAEADCCHNNPSLAQSARDSEQMSTIEECYCTQRGRR